jgi:16S rRNA (adenine1518-N6/adenine1519-N6)-dimethyltransferase
MVTTDFFMKKSLGQNFLIDKNVALSEVSYANITKEDIVLEVGPGAGILTEILADKAKQVIAIEIDKNIVKNLKDKLPRNVELINNDALKIDFSKLPKFNKIVSNLPFQISSPITFKFLEYDFDLAVLIYQKEFAYRMVADIGNKDYSRLSVGVYFKAECEILENVSRTCFKPQPNVDSCIVRLNKKKSPPFFVHDETFFFDLTKDLFNHRRKKIKNILGDKYSLRENKIPFLDKRVEELSPEQIGNFSNILYKLISKS